MYTMIVFDHPTCHLRTKTCLGKKINCIQVFIDLFRKIKCVIEVQQFNPQPQQNGRHWHSTPRRQQHPIAFNFVELALCSKNCCILPMSSMSKDLGMSSFCSFGTVFADAMT